MKRLAVLAALSLLAACGGQTEPLDQQGLTTTGVDGGADAGSEVDAGWPQCVPGSSQACGCIPDGQLYADGGASAYACASQQCDSTGHWGECMGGTPLVLSFDGAPVQFTRTASARFEIWGAGRDVAVDWPSARTPWLALDRNGNGRIDDGRELFGSMTVLPDGRRARNGFEALAALDSNHDGRIDPRDAAWSELRLWTDANGDRVSQPEELKPLSSSGVTAIALSYRVEPRCTARGDCEIERATFEFAGGVGQVVDVHLAAQPEAVSMR